MLDDHAPFAVFNRTANPVVRAVLSSPLHPLLSRELALITITGRRSGRRYTFPVGYRQDGDRVLIMSAGPSANAGGATCGTLGRWKCAFKAPAAPAERWREETSAPA